MDIVLGPVWLFLTGSDSLLMGANTTFHRLVLCALVPLLLNTNAAWSLKPQTLHALNDCQTP